MKGRDRALHRRAATPVGEALNQSLIVMARKLAMEASADSFSNCTNDQANAMILIEGVSQQQKQMRSDTF
jgi:phosphate/sulfate permease